ncbi:NAD-dependent epimerase/dehydratase family protein [Acidobacteria bacterium AH-259-L09]|nr:NAD-dependent epimerase/dehydratase family protein [Acidobacteria bacterium AH-259-L09]
MKVAVVGGSGFIGSHVVDKLVEHEHDVMVLDIMKTKRLDVVHYGVDITDLSKTRVALAGGYEAVYMLAAMANVNDVQRNPVESVELNTLAVTNVLEAARQNKVPRFIFASTVWVYEACQEESPDEDSPLSVGRVAHLYIASKICAEMCCHAYKNLYDQDFTILRYGIPYGPGARDGTVIATFIQKALAGEPLQIHGDGKQTRSFLYIEDLAEANVAALQSVATNRLYNLEGPAPVSIREVAETIHDVLGNVEIQFVNARPGDYNGKLISNQRARKELGWEPKVKLREGIVRYIDWLKRGR